MSSFLTQRPHRQSGGFNGLVGRWCAAATAAVVMLDGSGAGVAFGQPICAGRWDTAPSANGGVGGQAGEGIYAAVAMNSGDVVVGGNFSTAGGVSVRSVARYHVASGSWAAMGAGVVGNGSQVKALCALANGDVIAGGAFSNPSQGIVRWDHLAEQWVPMGVLSGGFRHVRGLLTLPDGNVMATGSFTSIDGVAANLVARWNPQTSTWFGWGNAVNGSTGVALALAPNGDVVLTTSGGLYRLSAVTDTWTQVSIAGLAYAPYAVTVLSDGDIVIGGGIGGGQGVVRLDATTGLWAQMGSVQGTLGDIVSTPDGEIFAMSTISTWQIGSAYSALMRWNSIGSAWELMQLGRNGSNGVGEQGGLALLANRDLFCGGSFTMAGGVPIINAAIWTTRPACAADFNCSTQLEVQDIFQFLAAWFAGESAADFNGGGVTVQDIYDFLDAWLAGC